MFLSRKSKYFCRSINATKRIEFLWGFFFIINKRSSHDQSFVKPLTDVGFFRIEQTIALCHTEGKVPVSKLC